MHKNKEKNYTSIFVLNKTRRGGGGVTNMRIAFTQSCNMAFSKMFNS